MLSIFRRCCSLHTPAQHFHSFSCSCKGLYWQQLLDLFKVSLVSAISSWDKSSNCQSVNTHSLWLRNYNAFVLLASQSVETCRNCLTLLDKIWPTSNSPDNPQVPLATRHVAHAKLVEPQHAVVAEVPRMQHCGCIVLSKRNWISTCSTKN